MTKTKPLTGKDRVLFWKTNFGYSISYYKDSFYTFERGTTFTIALSVKTIIKQLA